MREFAMVWLTGALCVGVMLDSITGRQQSVGIWIAALLFWPAIILRLVWDS